MNSDAQYYNVLNALYKGDYSKLKKSRERFHDWKMAWLEEKSDLNPAEEWKKLEERNIKLVLQNDAEYPSLLKEISFEPFGIYVLGNPEYHPPSLAIVGTRAATPQGKELAQTFARKLAGAGIAIVSGLAMGIDEFAHRGALEAGGKTIAVLGTPLNHLYPKQNEQLAKKILENNGAIISEFPLNQEYHPQNFLIRNRIISGLVNGILVIEAPERSGALATARFAIEQNRELFVIPGGIANKNYRGSNELIKAGAAIATDPKDILDYFGISESTPAKSYNPDAGSDEAKIIAALKNQNQESSVEQLLNATDLEVSKLNQLLALLTIKGIIKETNGKYSLL